MLHQDIIAIFFMVTFFAVPAVAEQPIAFLKNGEVWVKTAQAGESQLTSTNRKIDKIEVSPSGNFMSAKKIIGCYERENDIENPTVYFLEFIYSIIIIDLKKGELITELKAPKAMTHPLGWLPKDIYAYGDGTELEIFQEYQYNPKTRKIIPIENY